MEVVIVAILVLGSVELVVAAVVLGSLTVVVIDVVVVNSRSEDIFFGGAFSGGGYGSCCGRFS